MIKPISSINTMNIDPIKVPHKNNNVSFGGFSASKVKSASEDVLNSNFAKKVKNYAKVAIDFISDKFKKFVSFVSEKIANAKDVTKNPAKKTKALRNIAIGVGATAGVGAGAGGIKKASSAKKN